MENEFIEEKLFDKIDFTQTFISKGEYDHCKFISCDFSNSDLAKIKFIECEFESCNLSPPSFFNNLNPKTEFKKRWAIKPNLPFNSQTF